MFTEPVLNIQNQNAVSCILENPILFYTVWTPLIYSNVQSFTQVRTYFSFNGTRRRTFTKIMVGNGHYVLGARARAHAHTQRIQLRLFKYSWNKNKFPSTMIASWTPGRWSSKNVHAFINNFRLIFLEKKKDHCPPIRALPHTHKKKLLLNIVSRRKIQKIYLHYRMVEGVELLIPTLPGFKLP